MTDEVLSFLKRYFGEETADYRDSMRDTYARARPDVRERIRSNLAELIRTRSMSVDDFWRATWVRFPDADEMYRQFEEVYTEFFGDASTHNESGGPDAVA
jgi:hypothetical protein